MKRIPRWNCSPCSPTSLWRQYTDRDSQYSNSRAGYDQKITERITTFGVTNFVTNLHWIIHFETIIEDRNTASGKSVHPFKIIPDCFDQRFPNNISRIINVFHSQDITYGLFSTLTICILNDFIIYKACERTTWRNFDNIILLKFI